MNCFKNGKYSRVIVSIKFLCAAFAIVLIALIFSSTAQAATSGTDGTVEWTLDNYGTLTFSGVGEINGSYSSYSPKTVIINEGVTAIGGHAFEGCISLSKVTIADSVTTIGDYAFANCYGAYRSNEYSREYSGLKTVEIGEGVSLIGSHAFYGNPLLWDISIDCKCDIGEYAFACCFGEKYWEDPDPYYTGLVKITIGDEVKSIGSHAFYGNPLLWNVSINCECDIGDYAFASCYVEVDNYLYLDCIGYDNKVERSLGLETVNIGEKVKSIGAFAFYGNRLLDSVSIYSTCGIGDYAFSECFQKSIFYDDEEDVWYVFYKSLLLRDGVPFIGEGAFKNCSGLTKVSIPGSINFIGDSAFTNVTATVYHSFADETLPSMIGDYGGNLDWLKETPISIGLNNSKYDCNQGESFNISDKFLNIKYNSGRVDEIPLLEGMLSTYDKYKIGDQDVTVSYQGFSTTFTLTVIRKVVDSGNCGEDVIWELDAAGLLTISGDGEMSDYNYDDSPFYNKKLIKDVVIEDTITSIGTYAFSCCYNMETLVIPYSVTKIGENAFYNDNATIFYDSIEWLDEHQQNYGGNITWVLMQNSIVAKVIIGEDSENYSSLKEAFLAADNVSRVATIMLKRDTCVAEEDAYKYTSGSYSDGAYYLTGNASGIILDLNGHTIEVPGTMFLRLKVPFTITDSSKGGTGKIIGTLNNINKNGFIYNNSSNILTITGGTIEAPARYVVSSSGYKDGHIIISGGTIKNTSIYSIAVRTNTSNLIINAGTFYGTTYSEHGTKNINGTLLENEDGSWSVTSFGQVCEIVGGEQYSTFDEGIAALISAGQGTLKLLKDCEMKSGKMFVGSGKNITIDLNGFSLTNTYINSSVYSTMHRYFNVEGTLTIQDTSEKQTGSITVNSEYTGGGGITYTMNGGIVYVTGGNFFDGEAQGESTNNCWLNGDGGTHVIIGGWFSEYGRPTNKSSYLPGGYSTVKVTDDDKSATPYTITNTKKTICYNSNGGDGSNIDSYTYKYKEGYTTLYNVKPLSFTKEGYTCVGWSTNKDADPDGQEIIKFEEIVDFSNYSESEICLYAIYKQTDESMWVCVDNNNPTKGYGDLLSAFKYSSKDIFLIKNIESQLYLEELGDCILNLNGYNLSYFDNYAIYMYKTNLIIKNEDANLFMFTMGNEGIVSTFVEGGKSIYCDDATLKIYGGTYKNIISGDSNSEIYIYKGIFISSDNNPILEKWSSSSNPTAHIIPYKQEDVKIDGQVSGRVFISGGLFSEEQNNSRIIISDEGAITAKLTKTSGNDDFPYCVEKIYNISGQCGIYNEEEEAYNPVYWKLDKEGNLQIYGSGQIADNPSYLEYANKILNVEIGDGITSIGVNAFYQTSIRSILISKTVNYIGSGAFAYCKDLETIIVDVDNPKYDSRNNCNAIIITESNKIIVGCKNTSFSSDVTTIGYHSFWGISCNELILNDGLKTIENGAFYITNVNKIVFPNTVSLIESTAFCDSNIYGAYYTISFNPYRGNYGAYTLNWTLINPTSLEWVSLPTKIQYKEGESLDITGGIIKINYSYDISTYRSIELYNASGYNPYCGGIQEVSVKYLGLTVTYNIFLNSIDKIEVSSLPHKTSYTMYRDQLNTSGGELLLSYNNGDTEIIAITSDMVKNFDNTVEGTQLLTVEYYNHKAYFEVEVLVEKPVDVSIYKVPNQDLYYVGEELSLDGAYIKATYSSGFANIIPISSDMIAGYNKEQPGRQKLSVKYQGVETCFYVRVSAIKSIEIDNPQTDYLLNEGFHDKYLNVKFFNGFEKKIEISESMISGFNTTTSGTKKILISYGGKTIQHNINVLGRSVISIQVIENPDKVDYYQYDNIDIYGGKLLVVYNNLEEESINIEEYMVSNKDTTTIGEQEVEVSYCGHTTTFTINVIERKAEFEYAGISIGSSLTLSVDVNIKNFINTPTIKFTMANCSIVVEGTYNSSTELWEFDFEGIFPQNMNDEILMEIYDGEILINSLTYNVKEYCDTLISLGADGLGITYEKFEKLKLLLANLLEYGAATQLYLNYNVNNLPNTSSWVGECKKIVYKPNSDKKVLSKTINDTDKIIGATLGLSNVVKIRISLNVFEATKIVINNGQNKTEETIERDKINNGVYYYYSAPLMASDLSNVYTFSLEDDEGIVYHQVQYSVASYANTNWNNYDTSLSYLVQTLYSYGRAAKTY